MKIKDLFENDNNSHIDIDKAADLVLNSEYFKNNNYELRSDKKLQHGSDFLTNFSVKKIVDREKSKDTKTFLHDIVNKLSKSKFGVNIRNKLFATTDMTTAKAYGSYVYTVIPLNDYNLYYSDSFEDFFNDQTTIIGTADLTRQLNKKIIELVLNQSINDLHQFQKPKLSWRKFKKYIKQTIPPDSPSLNDLTMEHKIGFQLPVIDKILETYESNDKLYFTIVNTMVENIQKMFSNDFDIELSESQIHVIKNHINAITDEFIEYVKQKVISNIKENYIDKIKVTKSIDDIPKYTEIMVDGDEALFIKEEYFYQLRQIIYNKKIEQG